MTPTDLTPREFVACPGRMFALEQWHLLITALEMHRIHGVELVVAHILSVRDPLFELVRLYQLDGLLTIRSSLRMPSLISTLPYDANSETLWSNQIADFLDCLYEFRESAKFISFPDWDDLLLSGTSHRQFTPIAAILSNLSAMHPNSAVFVPKRFPGSLISLETMSSQNVSLHRLWTDGLRFSPTDPHPCNISKVILRPSMVSSVDLHYAHKLPYEKYEQIAVNSEELHFIEARNYNGEEFTLSSTLGRLVADRMNESFAAFLNRQQIPNSQPILRSLPQFELFLPTIMKCLMQIRSIVQNSARSHCFNVRQCWEVFPPIFDLFREEEGNYCVNVQTNWESFSCDGFGWTLWEGNCYKTFTFDLNFAEADALCKKFISHLMSILSEEENKLAKNLVNDGIMPVIGAGKEARQVGFWIGIKREGENGTWTDGSAVKFGRGLQDQPSPWDSEQNDINANAINSSICAEMLPRTGFWRQTPCDSVLVGAICKRKAVVDLDEGIPYKILLNQTVTGKGRLNINLEQKQKMLNTEQNLVEQINNNSDVKGWQATVHETFALMSDSSRGHVLGVMQPHKGGGGRSRRKRQAWPTQYQYPSNNQQQFEYSNQIYERYAAAAQYEYARHYQSPQQQYPQPQTPQNLNPEHMQELYKNAYSEYDKRELETALRGYFQYIALAYAQPKSIFPRHYDLRSKFPQCAPWIGLARDQGKCGACWAVATAAARDDRACIFLVLRNYLVFSNNPNLYSSTMDLISCIKEADGCNGGTPQMAWEYLEKYGYFTGEPVVNGSGCKPYVFPPLRTDPEKERKAPACSNHCQAGWKRMAIDKLSGRILPPGNETRYRTVIKTNHWGMDGFDGKLNCQGRSMAECYQTMLEGSERGIMAEIYYVGPVVATIDVYEDFYRYSKGIYRHTWGELKGGHAVKLIGWGEEMDADRTVQKYWLAVNSWNKWWGENGLFKIARGQNESGIEWRALDVGYIFF
uniref:C-type lectin domain-containing protein n=1 Tax=Globodera pallida TaxID=36090 RepID=A0A183C0W9_GLOPA